MKIRRGAPLKERFWSKVSLPDTDTGCMLWTGSHNGGGYGSTKANGRTIGAHRLAYMLAVGPIPDGLVLDHLCRVKNCVRPDHLEPVTQRENVARGDLPSINGSWNSTRSHCIRGHEFSGDNLIIDHRGMRQCRTCARARQREFARNKRQQLREPR